MYSCRKVRAKSYANALMSSGCATKTLVTRGSKVERAVKVQARGVKVDDRASKVFSSASARTSSVSHAWGVDTMASAHVSGDRGVFAGALKRCAPIAFKTASGSTVIANQVGDVMLRVRGINGKIVCIRVERVYYNKQVAEDLLSWQSLRERGWELESSHKGTRVFLPGRVVEVPLIMRDRVLTLKTSVSLLRRPRQAPPEGPRRASRRRENFSPTSSVGEKEVWT